MAVLGHIHSLSMRLFPLSMRRGDARALFALPTLILLLSLGLMLAVCAPAEAQRGAEINKLKAAFVYQFANFVEWPDGTFESDDAPFVICILGNDGLGEILRGAVRGKSVRGHSIRVETSPDLENTSKCQIMFIDESKSRNASNLFDDAAKNAVLTVGDSSDFTKNGGMIRLYPQASKLRIEVNIDAAERANLKVSSKLLGVATVVHDDRT